MDNKSGYSLPLLPPLQAQRGVTAVAGEVRTLNDQPLEGVTLRIADQTTRTDRTGRFLLTSLSPRHHVLLIDGRSASTWGWTYGMFEIGVDVKTGRTNVLPFTIWMPQIDTANAVSIPSPTADEVVVTNPSIPGLELHLPPGTIIRDRDGLGASDSSAMKINNLGQVLGTSGEFRFCGPVRTECSLLRVEKQP